MGPQRNTLLHTPRVHQFPWAVQVQQDKPCPQYTHMIACVDEFRRNPLKVVGAFFYYTNIEGVASRYIPNKIREYSENIRTYNTKSVRSKLLQVAPVMVVPDTWYLVSYRIFPLFPVCLLVESIWRVNANIARIVSFQEHMLLKGGLWYIRVLTEVQMSPWYNKWKRMRQTGIHGLFAEEVEAVQGSGVIPTSYDRSGWVNEQ